MMNKHISVFYKLHITLVGTFDHIKYQTTRHIGFLASYIFDNYPVASPVVTHQILTDTRHLVFTSPVLYRSGH